MESRIAAFTSTMSFAVIFVVLALVGLLLLWKFSRSRTLRITLLDDIVGRIRPVDLLAFRNLIDPHEESFLRDNLPPAEFRSIQRERLRVALEYVHGASQNAIALLRLGQVAAQSQDERIAR